MADNTVLNLGVGGDSVRDIDRGGGVKTQVVQLDIGGASAEKLLTPGQVTKANSVPVTIASDDDIQAKLGIVTETAPASDTASAGLNGRLQRLAQRLTSLIALLPTALGQSNKAGSLSVTLASDQGALTTTPQVGGTNIGNGNPMPILDAYVAPVTATWTSATALNTAQTVNIAGYDLVVVSIVGNGTLSGGQLTFEVYDGVAWFPVKSSNIANYTTSQGPALAANMNQAYEVPVAGFPQFRVRLSTVITAGSVAVGVIVSSAPDVSVVTVGMDPSAPLPAGTNTIGGVLPDGVTDNTLSAAWNGASKSTTGFGSVIVQFAGILAGDSYTVNGSVAGTTFVGLQGINVNSNATVNSVTADGIYAFPAVGFASFTKTGSASTPTVDLTLKR